MASAATVAVAIAASSPPNDFATHYTGGDNSVSDTTIPFGCHHCRNCAYYCVPQTAIHSHSNRQLSLRRQTRDDAEEERTQQLLSKVCEWEEEVENINN